MRVVQINSVCGQGSTGKICVEISKLLSKNNIENYILYSEGTSDYPFGIRYSSDIYKKWQALKSRIFGNYGFNSTWATKKLIKLLDKIKPDIVQIHNIHGHDCHLKMLFDYVRRQNIKVVWSLHDCWMLTGYCTHFTLAKCNNWQSGCGNCIQKRNYSWYFDNSFKNLSEKNKMLNDVDITFVVASQWLMSLIKKSHLKEYKTILITNGLDSTVFFPTDNSFREENGLIDKYIVIGVAYSWSYKKGIDVFEKLSSCLSEKYKIVLIGTDDIIDKELPKSILSIHRTKDQKKLAQLYSAADIFVNPTREETFGMTNIEALACGTPVITFDVGGSPETICEDCGDIVPVDDIETMKTKIIDCCERKLYKSEDCIKQAALFSSHNSFRHYIDLYTALNNYN